MHELAKERLKRNFKQSVKYLTLVFNDFFILALIFLFGAIMFWYARSLKTMPKDLWFYRPLVGLISWLPLLVGHHVTLLEKADQQFLLPQDNEFMVYLRPMRRYSLFLPCLLILIVSGILSPFALLKTAFKPYNYCLLILLLLLFKYLQLLLEERNLFFGKRLALSWAACLLLLLTVIAAYNSVCLYALLILTCCLISILYMSNKKLRAFDWLRAVALERRRKDRVYTIFSIFTDVSEKQVIVRRRKYLDFLLPKFTPKQSASFFLYRRSLLRNPDYLNLMVRMTSFAVLISFLVQDWRWAMGLSALTIFLTIYQLLPLIREYDGNVMYRVYPIALENRGHDFIRAIFAAVLLQWLLIAIFWVILLPLSSELIIAAIVLLVFSNLVCFIYLPVKLKQLSNH